VLLGNGDGTFQPRVDYATGATPTAVAVGDFNGDGNLDLVVASGELDNLGLLLGNGDGTFQKVTDLGEGGQFFPTAVAVGDFNRDGRLDIVSTNASGNEVSVLLGNGDGTFQPPVQYGVDGFPLAVVVGDFNHDGNLDLATVNENSNDVSVLLGNGDGTFQAAREYAVGFMPVSLALGDFNGDGNLDLVAANSADDDVSVLLGDGSGNFTARMGSPITVSGTPTSVAAADLNGDGTLDLAVVNKSNIVSVFAGRKNVLTHFGMSVPRSVVAGMPITVAVAALDAGNNRDPLFTLPVHLTSSDGAAVLPSAYTFRLTDFGIRMFTVTLKTAGSQTLMVTDLLGNFVGSINVTVVPAAASQLALTGFPGAGTAGVSGSFTVTAQDAFGNTASSYQGTVTFRSSDSQAVLPADYTFNASDAGVHTFSATLKTASSSSLTVADTVVLRITGTQSDLAVQPAAVTQLFVTGLDTPRPADASSLISLHAQDAFGNLVTDYAGTVAFASSDPGAQLPKDYTFAQDDHGIHNFHVFLETAGSQSLTVTDVEDGSLTGSRMATVTPILTLRGADQVVVGTPYTLELATTDLGMDRITQWKITWGDGTVETVAGDPSAVTHIYTRGPRVDTISATATDLAGAVPAANTIRVRVLVPKIANADSRHVEPGQRVTFQVGGIGATVASSPNDADGVNVLEAVYQSDPEAREADGAAFYDLQVDNASDETTLTATFSFPAGAANPTLKFFDEATNTYQIVQGSTLGPNSLVIDRVANVIQVTFDRSSSPSIRNLNGTVFTIAVPTTTTQTTDVSPSLALANTSSPSNTVSDTATENGLVQTTTFVSTNQLTLALSASQDSQLTASRAALGGGGESGTGLSAAPEEAGDGVWLRWFMKLLQDVPQWLQRFRDVQGLRQGHQESPATTDAGELLGEEAAPDAGSQSRQDVLGDLFAQALPDDQNGLTDGTTAPWLGEAVAASGVIEEPAYRPWVLAVSLVYLACQKSSARPERRGLLRPDLPRPDTKDEGRTNDRGRKKLVG
jgi:hypothetical protein